MCFLLCCFLKITSVTLISLNEVKKKMFIWVTPIWLPQPEKLYFRKPHWTQKKEKKNAIMPLKLNISAGHSEWWVNQRAGFSLSPNHPPTHARTHSGCHIYTNTRTRMLLDRNVHTLVDRAVHWGGLCFLSVRGRDEVMINMGDVWKCKSVLQHK